MKPSTKRYSAQTVGWLAATVLAIGAAGCGGSSSSSSGNGGSGPSGEELAALAATVGTAAVEDAQDEADESQDDPSGQSSSQPVALSDHVANDCTDGTLAVWDDEDPDHPATDVHYDDSPVSDAQSVVDLLKDEGGEDVFEGGFGGQTGTFANAQLRANCDDSLTMPDGQTLEYSIHGAMDHVRYELSDLDVFYTVMGGMDPDNETGNVEDNQTPPDPDNDSYRIDSEGNTTTIRAAMRGCEGCPGGDLESTTGDVRDEVFIGHMTLESHEGISWTLGDDNGPLSLVTEHNKGGDGLTHVELDGRLAQDMDGACSFDAVYDTTAPLQIENYSDEDGGDVQAGEMDVTVDGTTYNVEVINGEVFVDQEPVDTQNFQC